MVCLVCVDALRRTFWVITKCYNWWSGMPEMHPQPLPFFSRPDSNRSEPSYPQWSCSTCPQFAVDNLASTNKVFKYLWISLPQLNIMAIVLSRIGKTLGFGRVCMGGEGQVWRQSRFDPSGALLQRPLLPTLPIEHQTPFGQGHTILYRVLE